MSLNAGTHLGPYQILSPIGAGGMGEVYKAKDARLNRTVAIKVLRINVADKQDLKQRFEREAQAVAALNHPHICVLHDIGEQDGTNYIVMEHLDGKTLADVLANGPLPLNQALRYAAEIADALDKAHRHGVIHRDLKPANIMITRSGAKLLDFGLAKLKQSAAGPVATHSVLPTEASALTMEGTIIGTLQYMAPEQLEGDETDARTDIFAFGATLYEMVTGKKAFHGKSQASLISSIFKDIPAPVQQLAPATPPLLDHVITRCLAKEPDERWQSASDLVSELTWIQSHAGEQQTASAVAVERRRSLLPWAIAGVFFLSTCVAGTLYWRSIGNTAGNTETPPLRISIVPPENMTFEAGNPVISPDGRRVVFSVSGSLWVRSLDATSAQRLPGTDNAVDRFWSPDGKSIGFFADSKLKVIDIAGGTPQALADVGTARGGTWSKDGTIVYSPGGQGLFSVRASGGKPVQVTKLDATRQELEHMWPDFLPDGRHFLYFARTAVTENRAVFAGALDSAETKQVLVTRARAIYAPPGYLLFLRQGVLVAQAFDAQRLELRGEPETVTEGVRYLASIGTFNAYASNNGILAYRAGGDTAQVQLTWFDRSGQKVGNAGDAGPYANFSLSYDGKRIALDRTEQETVQRDIWLMDIDRGAPTRITFSPSDDSSPRWSPDGKRLFFNSNREGIGNCFQKLTTGGGEENPVRKSEGVLRACNDISPDGKVLIFHSRTDTTGFDLWTVPIDGDEKPSPFIKTPYNEGHARFSPDGKWIAYASEESGKQEIYVQRFPPTGEKHQISSAGGGWPRWRHDGRELFYVASGPKAMVASIDYQAEFKAGVPKELFKIPSPLTAGGQIGVVDPFDVSPDGQRLLFGMQTLNPSEPISLIVNWTALLKK